MTKPVDLRPDHAAIVQEVLARHLPAGVSVRVFGSRAKWTAKTFSDLDLAVKGKEKLPYKVMVELADAFEESDLPFRVDVIDWHAVTPSFQTVIDRDGVPLGEQTATSWETLKLSQLGRIVTGKTPPTSDASNFGGEIPFVTPSDMTGERSIDVVARTLTEAGARKVGSSYVGQPAVVVSCIGSDMGKAALVNRPFVSNQQINALVPSPDFDRLFIYYNLSARKTEIKGKASGAAQPIMNKSEFGNLDISIPDLTTQQDISGVLSSLDDKIDLNRRMNETLEGMVQAIFRDWFVDFGPVQRKMAGETDPVAVMGGLTSDPARAAQLATFFPDAFGDDGLPVGFTLTNLGNATSVLETGKRPKGGIKGINSGVPSIGAESIVGLAKFDFTKTKYVPREFFEQMGRGVLGSRDILLYKDGGRPGEFEPHVAMFGAGFPYDEACINEHVYRLVGRGHFSQEYLYLHLTSEDTSEEMRRKGTGVAIPGLNSRAAASLTILDPREDLLAAFTDIAKPLFDLTLSNANASKSFAETRDYLLPRLMSGTVRVARESEPA